MLEKLFGNIIIEKVLLYLLVKEKSYASEMTRVFALSLYSVQRALLRLEEGSIIVGIPEGKIVMYSFNPRYPFLKELKDFLQKVYSSLPSAIKSKYYDRIQRTRPRRRKKPLIKVKGND